MMSQEDIGTEYLDRNTIADILGVEPRTVGRLVHLAEVGRSRYPRSLDSRVVLVARPDVELYQAHRNTPQGTAVAYPTRENPLAGWSTFAEARSAGASETAIGKVTGQDRIVVGGLRFYRHTALRAANARQAAARPIADTPHVREQIAEILGEHGAELSTAQRAGMPELAWVPATILGSMLGVTSTHIRECRTSKGRAAAARGAGRRLRREWP